MNATVIKMKRETPVFRVSEHNFMQLAYARADYRTVFPVGTKPEDALKPECWSSVAHRLGRPAGTNDAPKTGAHIHCTTEDLAWEMELTVRAVHKQSLDVAIYKNPVFHGPQDASGNDAYETRWNVGARGFDIVRKSDNTIVGSAKDFQKKEDALAWIERMKA